MENSINNDLIEDTIQESSKTIPINNQKKYCQPAPLFESAKEHFRQIHKILAIFTLLKFVAAFVIIILRFTLFLNEKPIKNYSNLFDIAYLEIWMYLSCFHSFFSFIYYIKLLVLIGQSLQYESIAVQLEYMIEFYIPDSFSDQQRQNYIDEQVRYQNQEILIRQGIVGDRDDIRKTRLIAQEIKKKILQNNLLLNLHGKSCFIVFQFIQLWSLIFYFNSQTNTNLNETYKFVAIYQGYLFSIIFIGVYQYLEIYLMVLLVIVFLPILLIYSFCNWINKHFKNKGKIDDSLKETLFNSLDTIDDKECSICMTEFQEEQYIVTLTCSSSHRFHSNCIRSWLSINNKCPLCRNEVLISQEDIL
ncbi:unnamed protein product [Paramecium sonneborni]|uniref:RING-type domain-containing protein n=1 Tax=Paramecium sonneborni TaxID=65129 RepID=A0A8S1M4I3_9CILI|nr:unnamed protein product [Paramecium sonneborni]